MRVVLYILLLLISSQAWAVDTVLCGDDDNDGVVSLIKTSGLVDRDCDGSPSVADGGTDCDDTNAMIEDGTYTTSGCPGGEYRYCNAGTYTACSSAAIAPRTNNWYVSGSGSGTTCSAASPCLLSTVSTGGGKTITADTAIIVIGSTDFTGSEKFATTVAGTSSAARNIILKDPRSTAKIAPTTGCTAPCSTVKTQANNWIIQGLEVTAGDPNSSGGIRAEGDNVEVRNNYVHDTEGNNNNNNSGIYLKDEGVNIDVHDNIVNNTQDPTKTLIGDQRHNTWGIGALVGDDLVIENNRVGYDHAVNTSPYEVQGGGIRFKHGEAPASIAERSYIRNNIIYNTEYPATLSESAEKWVTGNLIVGSSACGADVGSSNGSFTYLNDRKFANNTCVTSAHYQLNINTGQAYGILGNSGSQALDGSAAGGLIVNGNVIVDSAQTTYGGGNFLGMIGIQPYGPDASYTAVITNRALESDNNCFYNSNITALTSGFPIFADNSSTSNGATVNFANWKLSPYLQDVNSFNANPALNSDYQVTTNCTTGMGWESEWPAGSSPTPTPTPTATPSTNLPAVFVK